MSCQRRITFYMCRFLLFSFTSFLRNISLHCIWLRGWCWQILTRDFLLQLLINLFIYLSYSQIFVDACCTPLKTTHRLVFGKHQFLNLQKNSSFLLKYKHFIYLMDFTFMFVLVPYFHSEYRIWRMIVHCSCNYSTRLNHNLMNGIHKM